MGAKLNVAVLIYPGVEMIDMNGPIDVFIKANGLNNGRYNIYNLAETSAPVGTEDSLLTITPAYTLANCPPPDIIVVPGQVIAEGPPPVFGDGSERLVSWLKGMGHKPGVTIMSVCIGIYILASTGLLKGKRVTTHYLSIKDFQEKYPDTRVIKNVRYVQDKDIMTTGGITSGIDGALYLIEQLDGPEIAQHVADIMVYNREAPLPPYTLLPPYDN